MQSEVSIPSQKLYHKATRTNQLKSVIYVTYWSLSGVQFLMIINFALFKDSIFGKQLAIS